MAPRSDAPLVTSRRGQFWIPGDRVDTAHGTVQRAPMYVAWESPETVSRPYPLVLVHGGGGQGTDWLSTVDGRPGWARLLCAAGFAVCTVDRPGHGRWPYHPDVLGPMGAPMSYEVAKDIFCPDTAAQPQTQWRYGREVGSGDLDRLVAPMGPLPADLAWSQATDADRMAELLDRIGPAVVITHSAGGPVGWLAADRRPDLVAGIVAIEPVGPAIAQIPGIGELSWGLTAAPVRYDPARSDPDQVRRSDPATLRIPALAGLPVAVVTGETSPFVSFAPAVVDFLRTAGAVAEQIHLPDHGIRGNGHGLTFEHNSDRTLRPVLDWITSTVPATGQPEGKP